MRISEVEEETITYKGRQFLPMFDSNSDWQSASSESYEPLDAVLLTYERAASITGQTLNVDGGWVMHW